MPGPAPSPSLTTPLAAIPGVSEGLARALALMGVTNLGRLVAHLPIRHEIQEAETLIAEIAPGRIIATRGEVTATRVTVRGRPRVEAVLHDGTGRLEVTWFNMLFMREKVKPGVRLWVQGKANRRGDAMQLVNPRQIVLPQVGEEPPPREARVRPIYPQTELIRSWQVEQVIERCLPLALPLLEDHLPASFCDERHMPRLADAYRMMHQPKGQDEADAARRRLAFDELFLLQLGVQMKRAHLRQALRAAPLPHTPELDARIRSRIPFVLTPAQDAVVAEIAADLSRSTPTNRLLQGDVGSGKTVVALYAMLMAVAAGKQAALMSPTEILAEQHYANLSRMLDGSGVRLALLTGSLDDAERAQTLAGLADGTVGIVVGTHALITDAVRFHDLALTIIDEQHRFGVHQRATLREKGGATLADPATGFKQVSTPHMLVMTATPIPRTLAITLFGDLDISIIDALPPGRTPVKTRVIRAEKRAEVYAAVRTRLDKGERAFVVVPSIGEDSTPTLAAAAPNYEDGDLLSVRAVVKELEQGPFAGKNIAGLHGRVKSRDRDVLMDRFRRGQLDVLVATTVIEVGVDVPEATVMIVEHADRFGLAQLHQLRGRVGRGKKASVCYLISDASTPEAAARLAVMEKSSDGFELAERDFELRGPGELFGTRQSGLPPFKVADLMRDRELLAMARRDAQVWIARSPLLTAPEEATLRRRLLKTYGESLGLGDVG